MVFSKESDFEAALIKILSEKGWEKEVLKNYSEQDLLRNWANILFDNNRAVSYTHLLHSDANKVSCCAVLSFFCIFVISLNCEFLRLSQKSGDYGYFAIWHCQSKISISFLSWNRWTQ